MRSGLNIVYFMNGRSGPLGSVTSFTTMIMVNNSSIARIIRVLMVE